MNSPPVVALMARESTHRKLTGPAARAGAAARPRRAVARRAPGGRPPARPVRGGAAAGRRVGLTAGAQTQTSRRCVS